MAAISKSYGEIRNAVMTAESCKADSGQVESFILTALLEIWSKVNADPFFLVTEEWTLDTDTTTGWAAPTQIEVLRAVEATWTDDEDETQCRQMYGAPVETPPVPCGCIEAEVGDACAHTKTGTPEGFEIVAGEFRLVPYPDRSVSLRAVGSRAVDCELYVDANDVRTWNLVDLPGEYHLILEMTVRAMAAAHGSDYNAATYWEQKASTALESLNRGSKNQVEREPEQPQKAGFDIVRAGRPKTYLDDGVMVVGTPVVYTQTVDCDGNTLSIEEQASDPRLA